MRKFAFNLFIAYVFLVVDSDTFLQAFYEAFYEVVLRVRCLSLSVWQDIVVLVY